ncbi:MAG: KamA family radical SAM protein [Planctomycetes bacterium]|nr:KamA family radical SAM protein [Planctomycetota bacterium]
MTADSSRLSAAFAPASYAEASSSASSARAEDPFPDTSSSRSAAPLGSAVASPNGEPASGRIATQAVESSRESGNHGAGVVLTLPTPRARAQRRFVIGDGVRAFRRQHFPGVVDAEWNDWKWQLRNRVRELGMLERMLVLSDDERSAVRSLGDRLPVGITPYYASLLNRVEPESGLRKTMVPVAQEFSFTKGEEADPLHEDGDMPVEGLVHRYPDRVLFLVTSFCAVYCRYCTRSRLVGKTGEYHFNQAQFQKAIDYIAAHPEIRDVLISGGDPLTMGDDRLEWLLRSLRNIPHVEFVRIGSKVPASLPQRITPEFVRMLRRYHPLWMSVHFMHPDEITPEVAQACGRLADAGIPLGSQTVLTAGVNDDPAIMKRLMHGLLKIRVRPYYIYQCDPIPGSAHFRTPVEKGLEIIEALRGHTTGYAVPSFVIDAPGGGGKIPLAPSYVVGREGDDLLIRNYAGETYRYPDPVGGPSKVAVEAAPATS